MSDQEFWRNVFLFWIYLGGIFLFGSMVWERSRQLAPTVIFSIFWFVFYPIAFAFLGIEKIIEKVTTWRR